MIKGVNKQVLEIIETENGYFEKALFFVKPEYSGYSENKLREIAQNELSLGVNIPKQKLKFRNKKIIKIFSFLGVFIIGFILGLSLTFVIWLIFYLLYGKIIIS